MRLLALYMKNRPEWIIAEQACFRYSASTVPMYDTLGADTVEMILNETELATVLCTPAEIKSLLKVKDMCPSLKNIIYVDEVLLLLAIKALTIIAPISSMVLVPHSRHNATTAASASQNRTDLLLQRFFVLEFPQIHGISLTVNVAEGSL